MSCLFSRVLIQSWVILIVNIVNRAKVQNCSCFTNLNSNTNIGPISLSFWVTYQTYQHLSTNCCYAVHLMSEVKPEESLTFPKKKRLEREKLNIFWICKTRKLLYQPEIISLCLFARLQLSPLIFFLFRLEFLNSLFVLEGINKTTN